MVTIMIHFYFVFFLFTKPHRIYSGGHVARYTSVVYGSHLDRPAAHIALNSVEAIRIETNRKTNNQQMNDRPTERPNEKRKKNIILTKGKQQQ